MAGPGDGLAKTRYISCTPLLGSDDQVGVWMVVMVENETVTGSLASRTAALNRSYTNHTTHTTHTNNNDPPIPQMPRTPEAFQTQHHQQPPYPNHHTHTHNESFDSDAAQQQQRYERTTSTTIRGGGGGGGGSGGITNGKRPGSEGGRLYAEFMRNQTSGSKKGAEEWKGDYLSNGGGGGVGSGGAGGGVSGIGDEGRFEEVGSP